MGFSHTITRYRIHMKINAIERRINKMERHLGIAEEAKQASMPLSRVQYQLIALFSLVFVGAFGVLVSSAQGAEHAAANAYLELKPVMSKSVQERSQAKDGQGASQNSEAPSVKSVRAKGVASDIEMDIQGMAARVHVTQYFYNDTDQWREGVYVYPLPNDSAVDRLIMMVGNKRIIGFVHEKEKAREIYEKAKDNGQATALMEQHKSNVFKTSVANIPPQSMVAIKISYQIPVALEGRTFSVNMPLAITPRYYRFSEEDVERLSQAQPWSVDTLAMLADNRGTGAPQTRGKDNPVTITARLNGGFELAKPESPSHKLKTREDGLVWDIKVLEKEGKALRGMLDQLASERDFTLRWVPKDTERVIAGMHMQEKDGEYFSQLVILPPVDFSSRGETPARHVSFVVDVSGSMAGNSMAQARKAVIQALEALNEDDVFTLISFDDKTKVFFDAPQAATPQNIKKAIRYVEGLDADGGTEMAPALKAALAEITPKNREYLRQILFLTDGAIGYEQDMKNLIRNERGDARIYIVGIGYAPNEMLLDVFARAGQGSAVSIQGSDDLVAQMQLLNRKMTSPVARDLKIDFGDVRVREMIPSQLPDLMVGDPVRVMVRSSDALQNVSLEAQKQNQTWRIHVEPEHMKNGDVALDKLYARAKIGQLNFDAPDMYDDKLKKDILALAIKHQIVSDQTSLVAVGEDILRSQSEDIRTAYFKPSTPKGWADQALSGAEAAQRYADLVANDNGEGIDHEMKQRLGLPQTATGYEIMMILSVVLLGFGGFLGYRARRIV